MLPHFTLVIRYVHKWSNCVGWRGQRSLERAALSIWLFDARRCVGSTTFLSARFSSFRVSAKAWQIWSVINQLWGFILTLLCTKKTQRRSKKTKSSPMWRRPPKIWRQKCFSFVFIFLRSLFHHFADHLEKDLPSKTANYTRLRHWKPQWKQLFFWENFPTQSWERKANDPWLCNPQILFLSEAQRHKNLWVHSHSLFWTLNVIKCRGSIQALSLKKVAMSTASRVGSACLLARSPPLPPSHRRRPVALAWRTCVRDTSSPPFGARLPTKLPGDPQVSGPHWGQDDTTAPLSPESPRPSTLLLDLLKVSSSPAVLLWRWRRSCMPLLHSHSWAAAPSLLHLPAPSSLARFLSSSTPSFALTLVIVWFLTVSLLLSHSGASVVAVENGYPCLFFFVITQIKIPMN